MQALQNILNQVTQQLGRLSVNAKLLIGAMVIILAMVLFLVSQYAGSADMSPLGLPNSADVRTRAVRYLDQARITYEDRGDDIYIPASQRFSVLGQLSEQEIVTANEIDFNALIDLSSNPFISGSQARQMWLTAKMNVLTAMISARDDVNKARVIIDDGPGRQAIGRAHVPPTASVMVEMAGTPLTQNVADVISHLVAGSHAGMKAEHVTVTDVRSNQRFRPRTEESALAGSYLEHKKKTEDHYRDMIDASLGHIPGTSVTVNAVIKTTLETSTQRTIDDPKIGPVSSDTRDFTATNASSAREPGVRTNVGVSLAGNGGQSQVTESTAKEEKEPRFGGSDTVIKDPTGYPLQVNAVIGIPKSWFVKLYATEQGDPEAVPDAVTLDALVQQQNQQLQNDLAILIRTDGHEGAVAGDIRVRMIHDFEVTAVNLEGVGDTSGGMATMVNSPGLLQNVGLIVLAVVSIVMMFLMVRKATATEPLPTAEELAGIPPSLDKGDEFVIGEADGDEPVLDGIELDEETMRTQQLVKEINEMIQGHAEESAGIFEQWMQSG